MREYKFRGKPFEDVDFDEINVHISKNDFVYGNLIVDGKVAYIVNGIVEATEEYLQLEQWIRVRPETVGQYTGLKDKNGKEIYEEDMVRYDDDDAYIQTVKYGYQQIDAFEGIGFNLWTFYGEDRKCSRLQREIEIIGNIHNEVK